MIPEDILALSDWPVIGEGFRGPSLKPTQIQAKFYHYIRALCLKVKEQDAIIKELSNTVEGLKQKQSTGSSGSEMTWSRIVANDMKSEESRVMRASVTKVVNEIKSIEKNVVITGLPDNDNTVEDTRLVNDILGQLNMRESSVKNIRRIKGKRIGDSGGQRHGKIVVELVDLESKQEIIRKASKLKDTDYKAVYINSDESASERELEFNLRKKRNEMNSSLEYGDGRQRYGKTNDNKKFYYGIRWHQVEFDQANILRVMVA